MPSAVRTSDGVTTANNYFLVTRYLRSARLSVQLATLSNLLSSTCGCRHLRLRRIVWCSPEMLELMQKFVSGVGHRRLLGNRWSICCFLDEAAERFG